MSELKTKSDFDDLNKAPLVDEAFKLYQENLEKDSIIEDMQETIEQLKNAQAEELQDARAGVVKVKHEKQEYLVAIPSFRLGAEVYTAQDLKADKDLVNEVLALEGQQILKPINS